MPNSSAQLRILLRKSLLHFIEMSFYELNPGAPFLMNWHIELIANALEDCFYGRVRRLIINVPPRSLKSHCVSVAFVAWLLGHRPASQVIAASYAQDLADKHARDCRHLMASETYENLFQTRLSATKSAVNEFTTTRGGTRISTSVGGPMTGRGADFIIVDDPLKPDDALSEARRNTANEWFNNTVLSRLNDKQTGSIILIMQRLHEDDLTGHLLASGGWHHLSFPAIAEEDETYTVRHPLRGTKTVHWLLGEALHPEREPLDILLALRRSMGEYNFAGQYQQAPAPLGGGLVKIDWFRRYTQAELPTTFDFVFQSWDTANTATNLSDYSACTTWGVKAPKLYLLHVLRKRLEYPELRRVVLAQAQEFGVKNILIEDKASGTQLLQELKADGLHGVVAYRSDQHKVVRMNTVTATLENGFVQIPDTAAWLPDFLHEVSVFPNGKNDDQADSMSQALDWFKNKHSKISGILEYYERLVDRENKPTSSLSTVREQSS